MNEFLKALLSRIFNPGVEGDEEPLADDVGDADLGGEETQEEDLGEDDGGEEHPAGQQARARSSRSYAVAEARARAEAAERTAQEARAAVEQMQRQHSAQQDPQFLEEEARLRSTETSDLEKWQIQANRTMRANQQATQQMLFKAQDESDRAAYTAKAVANKTYQQYQDRVEKELATVRSKGGNIARETLLHLLIGKDIAEGKFKPKAEPTKKVTQEQRGKPHNARSDVQSRGAKTDREKRAARLQNVFI